MFFFFQAEDGIRYHCVTGVQTCALPILEVEEQITRSGMVGAKLTVRNKADNYWFRHSMLIFSSGKEHFRVVALTQEEFFDGRSEERRVGKECRSRWSTEH